MDTSTTAAVVEAADHTVPTQVDRPHSPSEARAARFARAIVVALLFALVFSTAAGAGLGSSEAGSDRSSDGPRLGGDFPAFYAAGSIVRDGDIDMLYEAQRQELEQVDLGIDGYLAFAYPPHVAAAYAPLSMLAFKYAYGVHTLLMAAALVVALHVLGEPVPLLRRWKWPLLAGALTFYPLLTAVGGGQNASLSVLLLALVWRGLHDDRPALAGVAAGLLMYRPQYALPVIGLLLLSRQFRAVAWSAVVAGLTWAAVAVFLGARWLTTWFDAVLPFVERDADVNAANSISILGFLQAAWGTGGPAPVVVGAVGAAAVVLVLMWFWAQPDRFPLAYRMGVLAAGIVLISPHTMFYDGSLLLIAGAALLATSEDVTPNPPPLRVLALVWVAALVHVAADGLGATPLALVVMASFGAFVWHTVSSSSSSSPTTPSQFGAS